MTLLEKTSAMRDKARLSIDRVQRAHIQQALYQHISAQRIAQLAVEDRARARHEVTAALDLVVGSSEFKDLSEGIERGELVRAMADLVLGLGPLESLLADESVTEVMVNAPDKVFYEREGRLYQSAVSFADETQVRAVIDRIVAPVGRRVDEQSPIANARLPEGHRVNIIVPPLAIDGPAITIRKFRATAYRLSELVELETLSSEMAKLLSWAVRSRRNIAVSGGTGGGKTTLLNALSDEIGHDERIITIEDSAELRFQRHPHVVRLEARQVNAEGTGEVTIRDLVINSLRMRPDRIIVGECRGEEALDMLQAMNTGHDGSLTTLHANSAEEVVPRLVMMARYGSSLSVEVIEEQIASAIGLVVQQDRFPDGTRRITQIAELKGARAGVARSGDIEVGATGMVRLVPIVEWDQRQRAWMWRTEPSWLARLPIMQVATEEEVQQWRTSVGL